MIVRKCVAVEDGLECFLELLRPSVFFLTLAPWSRFAELQVSQEREQAVQASTPCTNTSSRMAEAAAGRARAQKTARGARYGAKAPDGSWTLRPLGVLGSLSCCFHLGGKQAAGHSVPVAVLARLAASGTITIFPYGSLNSVVRSTCNTLSGRTSGVGFWRATQVRGHRLRESLVDGSQANHNRRRSLPC